MSRLIIKNILFDDLYVLKKFEQLRTDYFFLNILDNRKDEKDTLESEYNNSVFLRKEESSLGYFEQDLDEDEIKRLHKENDFSTSKFEVGYLKIAIANISDFFHYNMKKQIREKAIYAKSARINFYKDEKERLLKIVDYLQEAEHLNEELTNMAVHQAFDCMDLLSEKGKKEDTEYEKIPFTLNKVDVMHLFFKMYESNLIDKNITLAELASIIEKYCLYNKSRKMVDVYDSYYEYKSGRSNSDTSINRIGSKLSKIFHY